MPILQNLSIKQGNSSIQIIRTQPEIVIYLHYINFDRFITQKEL